jgi:hypothetical protein
VIGSWATVVPLAAVAAVFGAQLEMGARGAARALNERLVSRF